MSNTSMVKWWVCYSSATWMTSQPLCQDRRLQLLPGVCCGSRSSVWLGELAGNTSSTWAALQMRPAGARSEQEPVRGAARGPSPSMPCTSCATRLCAMLQAGLPRTAQMIGCAVSCAHGCSRKQPVNSAYTQPGGWLPFQSAWGPSSSGTMFLHSLAQSLGLRSLHSVPLMSLNSQETA